MSQKKLKHVFGGDTARSISPARACVFLGLFFRPRDFHFKKNISRQKWAINLPIFHFAVLISTTNWPIDSCVARFNLEIQYFDVFWCHLRNLFSWCDPADIEPVLFWLCKYVGPLMSSQTCSCALKSLLKAPSCAKSTFFQRDMTSRKPKKAPFLMVKVGVDIFT